MAIRGFVDLQVNGFVGVNFSDPDLTRESARKACGELLKRGTAAFLPTLITAPMEVYEKNLPLMAKIMDEPDFRGRLLGFHMEGPFISPKRGAVGAHNPEWVIHPHPAILDRLVEFSENKIKLITVAPEAPGATDTIRYARSKGISVSLGHHLATEDQIRKAADAGATALTHLGNGIPNILERHPNPIWAGLAEDKLTAMIIADGHHLPVQVLKTMIRAKGTERIIITSDASPMAGMPPGKYETLNNQIVLEPSGLLHNPEKGCLVGSSATLMQCMNHVASLGILDVPEMIRVGFDNPLNLINVSGNDVKSDYSVGFDQNRLEFLMD